MTRKELLETDEYHIAGIELELWRQAGEPVKGPGKYETQAKKIWKAIKPGIKELLELQHTTNPTTA